MTARRAILVLNAGSSSLKFALFDTTEPTRAAMRGEIENLDDAPRFSAVDGLGAPLAGRLGLRAAMRISPPSSRA